MSEALMVLGGQVLANRPNASVQERQGFGVRERGVPRAGSSLRCFRSANARFKGACNMVALATGR